jgi:PTH1 family peptidyl-tRNA hydrolase
MLLAVGLGNPGARYESTRHNVGFMVADRLVTRHAGTAWRTQFQGEVASLELGSRRVLALKPQTFMNKSGYSVRNAMTFYKIPAESVVVIHDELDLPFGVVRLKVDGGEAGHNGLRSVSEQLGTKAYIRLRFGIGRPPPSFRGDPADYVLEAFAPGETPELEAALGTATDAIELLLSAGIERAMNQINRKQNSKA